MSRKSRRRMMAGRARAPVSEASYARFDIRGQKDKPPDLIQNRVRLSWAHGTRPSEAGHSGEEE